ncbi:hypothetical protein [Pseudonocardia sp. GCM10023141]|uniref:hypothetical protein n=1 Tax=Pseudonocardia sp. GCM10023141 TaxID=3252653 RepID=UPI00361A4C8B
MMNHSVSADLATARRNDLIAAAASHRLVKQARATRAARPEGAATRVTFLTRLRPAGI